MFGYATNETEALMPMPIQIAHRLSERLSLVRKDGTLPKKWIQTESKLYTQADDPKKVYEEKKGLGY